MSRKIDVSCLNSINHGSYSSDVGVVSSASVVKNTWTLSRSTDFCLFLVSFLSIYDWKSNFHVLRLDMNDLLYMSTCLTLRLFKCNQVKYICRHAALLRFVMTRHLLLLSLLQTVYPKKYAHGYVVFCFVLVMQSFLMNSHEVFIHINQACFAGTGAIVRLPQCQWSKPDGYGKISQCITTTKHSKAKTVCIFLWICCILSEYDWKATHGRSDSR